MIHSTRLLPGPLGYTIDAVIGADLDQSHLATVVEILDGMAEVLEAVATGGDQDILDWGSPSTPSIGTNWARTSWPVRGYVGPGPLWSSGTPSPTRPVRWWWCGPAAVLWTAARPDRPLRSDAG